jgi:hypothetical protein
VNRRIRKCNPPNESDTKVLSGEVGFVPSRAVICLQLTESTLPTLPNLLAMPPTIARYCTLEKQCFGICSRIRIAQQQTKSEQRFWRIE